MIVQLCDIREHFEIKESQKWLLSPQKWSFNLKVPVTRLRLPLLDHYWCWLMLLDADWFWFIQIDPFFSLLCVVSFRHFLMNRTRCIEVKIVLVAFHQNQLYLLFKYNVDKFCKILHAVYISIISVYYNHMINYAGQTASSLQRILGN